MMTAPKRPRRQTVVQPCSGFRDINRNAYRLGAAAVFNAVTETEDPATVAAALYERVIAEVRKMCAAASATAEQTDIAINAANKGFFEADYPPNALVQVFSCIREREQNGIPTIGPTFLTKCKPQVYPRLFCGAVMMSYDCTGSRGNTFVPFPFACNAVAAAYTETFGEHIDPPTVNRFITTAVMMRLLEVVRHGTKGAHGLPGLYRVADGWMVADWGVTDDMLLRQRWTQTAYEIRTVCGMV